MEDKENRTEQERVKKEVAEWQNLKLSVMQNTERDRDYRVRI